MSSAITIVGLGPGDPQQLTLEAWRVLSNAQEVYLRTRQHPCVDALPQGPQYHSFDSLYEQYDTFDAVYREIAEQVITLGQRPEGVVYAVPGHPMVGETSVQHVRRKAKEARLQVRIVAGVSFIEPVLTALGIDALDGLQIVDATILAQRYHPNLDPDVPALVAQIYNRALAAQVKLTLMNLYHDDHPLVIVQHAGTPKEQLHEIPLYELDRQDTLDHLTSAYLPPLAQMGSFTSYCNVMAALRAPGGCPWDREQTHQSLRHSLLEETYEVLEAIDAEDMGALKEELGDLLLQVLFHAQIATEDGDFRLIDSIAYAIRKLIRRHPHVFGKQQLNTAQEVLQNWEQIKRAERGDASQSMLSGISKALPALSRALAIQQRVARVGFDWPKAKPVAEKVVEEIREFLAAPDAESRAAELGDILFSLVNLARWHDIDPESALRQANERFARRFAAMERQAAERGVPLEEMSLEELDALWEQAKAQK